MVTIVSKNQGWITVNPDKMDRKKPVEKDSQHAGDAAKTSILTPSWMQMGYPGNKTDNMKPGVQLIGLRAEANRTFLFDK